MLKDMVLQCLKVICFFLSYRYFDPEAVVGCEDGTARVFDMYSRKCSQIIRYLLSQICSFFFFNLSFVLSFPVLHDILIVKFCLLFIR